MKKVVVSLTLALSLISGGIVIADSTEGYSSSFGFSDIAEQIAGNSYKNQYEALSGLFQYNAENGTAIFRGYPDKSFRAENTLTREEASWIICEYLSCDFGTYPEDTGFVQFDDVEKDRWSNWHIGKLASIGVVRGYTDGNFDPEGEVSRAEFVAMLERTYEFLFKEEPGSIFSKDRSLQGNPFNDISKTHWAFGSIEKISREYSTEAMSKYVNDIGGEKEYSFVPDESISRMDAAIIFNDFIQKNKTNWVYETKYYKSFTSYRDKSQSLIKIMIEANAHISETIKDINYLENSFEEIINILNEKDMSEKDKINSFNSFVKETDGILKSKAERMKYSTEETSNLIFKAKEEKDSLYRKEILTDLGHLEDSEKYLKNIYKSYSDLTEKLIKSESPYSEEDLKNLLSENPSDRKEVYRNHPELKDSMEKLISNMNELKKSKESVK